VTHDANHGSYSPHRRLERIMRWSLDLIGGSSYVWRVKHNVVHHTFTNISGADGDIEQLPFMRLAPDQRRRWFHRHQHFYVWPLYGAFAVKWQLLGDLQQLRMGQVEGTPLPWPRGRELLGFWLGKLVFVGWAIGVPLLVRPAWQVGVGFALASFVMAFVLAVTFQLAHCVEEADFSSVEEIGQSGRTEWARHQVATTVNFAPRSRALSWYLGGLNYQIEHHLFPSIARPHLRKIQPLVAAYCAAEGVPYTQTSIWAAYRTVIGYLNTVGLKGKDPFLCPLVAQRRAI
jgi:linoleoyl-CoA desaturase